MMHWSDKTQLSHALAIEELHYFVDRLTRGVATMRVLAGEEGFGRSFLLKLVRQYAFKQNVAVLSGSLLLRCPQTDAERGQWRLTPSLGRALFTAHRPDGTAAADLLARLVARVERDAAAGGIGADILMDHHLACLRAMRGGDALADTMAAYWSGRVDGNEGQMAEAVKWLRGTQPGGGGMSGCMALLDEIGPHDFFSLLSVLVGMAGYEGLLVVLDDFDVAGNQEHPAARAAVGRFVDAAASLSDGAPGNLGVLLVLRPPALDYLERNATHGRSHRFGVIRAGHAGYDQPSLNGMMINVPSLCLEDMVT